MNKKIKRLLTDFAGAGLIIIGLSIGWINGHGGIKLIIDGIGLLAINNKWAENILKKFVEKGEDFSKILFPKSKKIQILHDIISVMLIFLGILSIFIRPHKIFIGLGMTLVFIGVSECLINRDRLQNIKKRLS